MTNKITFFQFKESGYSYPSSAAHKKEQKLKNIPLLQKKLEELEYEVNNPMEHQAHLIDEYREKSINVKNIINKLQKEISNLSEYKRIAIEDLSELNEEVEKMNKQGWNIKQIQGIQSGMHNSGFIGDGGFGYGYGFTEGIMIVWEK
jgi:hypothetical protein